MSEQLDTAPPKRRPRRTNPTARTTKECRKRHWLASIVEKRVPRLHNVTRDMFGFIDVVALDGELGLLGIQTTSSDHVADRIAKIVGECASAAAAWLQAGNRVQVWGWAKRGAGPRKLWTLRRVAIHLVGWPGGVPEFREELLDAS